MLLKADYIFSLAKPVLFKVLRVLYITDVNSRVSAFICCIIHANPLVFYKTGILLHSYKNKTNGVRLLPAFAGFYQFLVFHCLAKNTFCHGKNPTLITMLRRCGLWTIVTHTVLLSVNGVQTSVCESAILRGKKEQLIARYWNCLP